MCEWGMNGEEEAGIESIKKAPERITIAMDEETFNIFKKLRSTLKLSQSGLMREALKFYNKHRKLFESVEEDKIRTYIEMLSAGEHIILDIDHWLLFLKFVETHPEREKFWEAHREICRSHAEQFSQKSAEEILRRLEACNFFKLSKISEGEFTLVLSSDVPKKFIKTEIEGIFTAMGIHAVVREDIAKLRVRLYGKEGKRGRGAR